MPRRRSSRRIVDVAGIQTAHARPITAASTGGTITAWHDVGATLACTLSCAFDTNSHIGGVPTRSRDNRQLSCETTHCRGAPVGGTATSEVYVTVVGGESAEVPDAPV
jgi:hypothetical protein